MSDVMSLKQHSPWAGNPLRDTGDGAGSGWMGGEMRGVVLLDATIIPTQKCWRVGGN